MCRIYMCGEGGGASSHDKEVKETSKPITTNDKNDAKK